MSVRPTAWFRAFRGRVGGRAPAAGKASGPEIAMNVRWLAVAVGGMGALALALRWHAPYSQVLYPDAAYYMRRAAALLTGEGAIAPPWAAVPGGGPVYPLLSGLLAPFSGGVESAGTVVSRLAGVALAMGVTWAGIRLGGWLAGLLAGALVVFAPPLVHLSEVRLSDALFLVLWPAALLWGGRLLSRPRAAWEGPALGALLGIVVLTRAVGLTAVPAVVGVLLLAGLMGPREARRSRWLGAGGVVLGALLVVAPYQGYAWNHGWRTSLDYPLPQVLAFDAAPDGPVDPAPPPEAAAASRAGPGTDLGRVALSIKRQMVQLGGLLPVSILALAIAGMAGRTLRRRRDGPAPGGIGADLMLLGGAATYLLALALYESSLTRYLVALYPVVFLYAGLGLAAVATGMGRLLGWRRGSGPATVLALILFVVLTGSGVAVLRTDAAGWRWKDFPPFDRTTARMAETAAALEEPVYVYADTGGLAYYLDGYWLGPAYPGAAPAEPADAAPTAGAGGTRVVLLNTKHRDRWPEAWRAAFAAGTDLGEFRLTAQRYWPAHHRVLTVYVQGDAAPPPRTAPPLAPDANLAVARRAYLAAPDSRAALNGLGAIELLMGQYAPERIPVALAYYRRAEALPAPASAPTAAPGAPARGRVWWAFPPGEIYLAQGEVASHWNRAAGALAAGRPEAAWPHVRAVAGALGPDPRLAYLKGMVLLAMGETGRALPALRRAGLALTDDPAVQVSWANALATAGRFGKAATVYRRVLARDPDNFGLWLNLYQVLAQARRWDAADAARQRMSALSPTSEERDAFHRLVRQVERARDLG
jgi:tetratricopeptide (TPR) repeat protein